MRALNSLEDGRELPLGEAIREVDRISGKMDGVRGWRDREGLEKRLREVSHLVF
jgi:hypothetical protein